MLDTKARHYVQDFIDLFAVFLIKRGLTADSATIIGFFIGLSVPGLLLAKLPFVALIALWISGLFDAVDGTIARMKGGSPIGTLLDITLDRIVELSVITVLAVKYPHATFYLLILVASIVVCITVFLTTGILVNKYHIKSFYYSPGLMERAETFIMLSLFVLFPKYLITLSLIFTGLITYTSISRFIHTKKILDKEVNNESI